MNNTGRALRMDERAWVALSSLKIDEAATVERIDVEGRTRRRLVEMGITPGTRVAISRRAPLGDPIEIALRGYVLTLREEDARRIQVSKGGGAE